MYLYKLHYNSEDMVHGIQAAVTIDKILQRNNKLLSEKW